MASPDAGSISALMLRPMLLRGKEKAGHGMGETRRKGEGMRRGRGARAAGAASACKRAAKRAKHARRQEVAAHARAPSHGPAAAPAHALLVQLFEKGLRFVIRQRPHSSWRTGEEKNQHAET